MFLLEILNLAFLFVCGGLVLCDGYKLSWESVIFRHSWIVNAEPLDPTNISTALTRSPLRDRDLL